MEKIEKDSKRPTKLKTKANPLKVSKQWRSYFKIPETAAGNRAWWHAYLTYCVLRPEQIIPYEAKSSPMFLLSFHSSRALCGPPRLSFLSSVPRVGPGNWPKESVIKWEFNREIFVFFKQSMHESLRKCKKSFPTRHCTLWCNPPRIGFWVSTGAKKSAGISFVPEKKARGSLG